MKNESNYEIMKRDALRLFLSFNQEKMIDRLQLEADPSYIYVDYCRNQYRFHRSAPFLERREDRNPSDSDAWVEADPNEAMTLCDLMCHTEEALHLSSDFISLQSLNRVKGGTMRSSLASGMMHHTEEFFDGRADSLRRACEKLGGIPAGKGDVAYEIPLFRGIHVRLSFYESDDEFGPQLTLLFPANICKYLYYETLYYAVGTVIGRLEQLSVCKDEDQSGS